MDESLSEKLRAAMEKKGLRTQSALAKRAGVGQATIHRMLHGSANPGYETLEQIARALDIPLSQLVGEQKNDMKLGKNIKIEVNIIPLPVYAGVRCGLNGVTRGEMIDLFPTPMRMVQGIPNPEQNCFWVVAERDSMLPRIKEGDLVLAVKGDVVEIKKGDFVIFTMGDETTLKKYQETEHSIILWPLNDNYDPVEIKKKDIVLRGFSLCKVLWISSRP
ncbi:MAG: LexA family transcriptional regulator [Magnetococcales bacterium]|nr:LexA family transcriptional regulator [Nitrospirota bacterium]